MTVLDRRRLLAAAAVLAASGPLRTRAAEAIDGANALVTGRLTIDIHSHAGGFLREASVVGPVVEEMRAGGLAVACLAIVADGPTHKVFPDRTIHPVREPSPGELYSWSVGAFGRLLSLAQAQGAQVVGSTADLRAAPAGGAPAVIIASEGADFLEGRLDRVDEARVKFGLRHLQLVHYRPNELGDIQTEAPVHNGLTDFGAAVIRECNRLGIVVDVAHAPYELVKRAAETTTRPLILSHTSLSPAPGPRSRLISADHARIVAGTGGVIGVWPPASIYPTVDAMAAGMARLAQIVGVDHVGLGTDMRGLTGPSVLPSYRSFPLLAQALLARGFSAEDAGKILGGNYARVFSATVG
jgi:membrane dipeptidase